MALLVLLNCLTETYFPAGRAWAAVTTEGLLVYALDSGISFDPFDLTEDITPDSIELALNNAHYSSAVMMSFKLNEKKLIAKSLESVPPADSKAWDICIVCPLPPPPPHPPKLHQKNTRQYQQQKIKIRPQEMTKPASIKAGLENLFAKFQSAPSIMIFSFNCEFQLNTRCQSDFSRGITCVLSFDLM